MKRTLGILLFILTSAVMVAQQVNVTGRVAARSDGSPIPGVSVVQQGTSMGTITDSEGRYPVCRNGRHPGLFLYWNGYP